MTDKNTVTETNLYGALFNVQQKAPSISKATSNPFFKSKYADMSDIWDALKPILAEEKILVMHQVYIDNGHEILKTIITHVPSGESFTSEKLIVLSKQTSQEFGSYMTYMRRYMITSMFGLITDNDDDGNKSSDNKQITNKQQTNNKQITTLEKGNNDNKEINIKDVYFYQGEVFNLNEKDKNRWLKSYSNLDEKILLSELQKAEDYYRGKKQTDNLSLLPFSSVVICLLFVCCLFVICLLSD